jgi:assimilatory nitrate reductase catalytic subunit
VVVCHCRRVTDREIASLVREGVAGVDAVGRYCGAATSCGGCRPEVERLVAIADRPHSFLDAEPAPAS